MKKSIAHSISGGRSTSGDDYKNSKDVAASGATSKPVSGTSKRVIAQSSSDNKDALKRLVNR